MKKRLNLLAKFDLTEIFRDKGGLRKWSAKRTVGGLIVTYALASMDGEIEWKGVVRYWIPFCYPTRRNDRKR